MYIDDLKLGDWVSYSNKPTKIKGLKDNMASLADWGTLEVHPRYLSPILITEEILEKSKWEDTHCCYVFHWNQIRRVGSTDMWHISRMGVSLGFIKYVHELQHIMWVLGFGDEIIL